MRLIQTWRDSPKESHFQKKKINFNFELLLKNGQREHSTTESFSQQGEYAVDIAIRKDFHEIVSFLQKPPPIPGRAPREDRERSKSRSRTKREKTDSGASSKDSGRRSTKPKERKRVLHTSNLHSLKSISNTSVFLCRWNQWHFSANIAREEQYSSKKKKKKAAQLLLSLLIFRFD